MRYSLIAWLAGDLDHTHFAPAVAWLRHVALCEFVAWPVARSSTGWAIPAAIVLFQARPCSITEHVVERLHRLAPLAKLIVVAGPWCEGEQRSGRPAQGVARI